ncbi:hypothetical protein T492DRAFT_1149480 [Pavlovales sp. CCMP2436]|nr:hypothetical protein T492DRAFT_1149480 [Pavlovales sp. CCMP2436]
MSLALLLGLLAPLGMAMPADVIIPLPNGFFPEGVVAGPPDCLFVGSIVGGTIAMVNTKTSPVHNSMTALDGDPNRRADRRWRNDWTRGGANGIQAFDLDGQLLGEVVIEGGGFVNDIAVTADAAYGTDSHLPVLYKWPFLEDGIYGALETIQLGGDYVANGDHYKVNPAGMSTEVDVKDEAGEPYQLLGGNGMVLCGESRLVVMAGSSNQLVVVTLGQDWMSADVTGFVTSDNFDDPATAAVIVKTSLNFECNCGMGCMPAPSMDYTRRLLFGSFHKKKMCPMGCAPIAA